MKIFDVFYKEYLEPFGENIASIVEEFSILLIEAMWTLGEGILIVALFITIPLWIIPYKIAKKKEDERSEEENEE